MRPGRNSLPGVNSPLLSERPGVGVGSPSVDFRVHPRPVLSPVGPATPRPLPPATTFCRPARAAVDVASYSYQLPSPFTPSTGSRGPLPRENRRSSGTHFLKTLLRIPASSRICNRILDEITKVFVSRKILTNRRFPSSVKITFDE